MSNVTPLASARRKSIERYLATRKKDMLDTGTAGHYTSRIWRLEALLQELGWTVELNANTLPAFTAWVDYDNQVLRVNNASAYYTWMMMERVEACVNTSIDLRKQVVGHYVYQLAPGEQVQDGPGYTYTHDHVAIRRFNPETDVEVKPHTFTLPDA